MLVKDPAKRISWEELFERELSQKDLLNVSPMKVIQTASLNDRGLQCQNSSDQNYTAFLYFIQERNKLLYLYYMAKEILSLNFDSPDMPIVHFCFTQYMCRIA